MSRQAVFIDIHAHAQRVEGAPRHGLRPWATARQLLARYDELGIAAGVVHPLIGPEFYEPQGNADILEMAEAHPERIIPFFCIHPAAIGNSDQTDFRPLIAHYLERGCKGFGEVTFNVPFDDPRLVNLLTQLSEFKLPMTIHLAARAGGCYGLIDEPGLPGLAAALERFPGIDFLGHSPVFWTEIARLEDPAERTRYPKSVFQEEGAVPRLMRRFGNLHGDLSAGSGCNALVRNPDYAVQFLAEFQDRLLFGTDICAPDTPAPLAAFLIDLRDRGRISGTVFEKVACGNARRLLRLARPPAEA